MKSYDCTICFQFFRYIIHDNGVLEYLELSGTGETKKSESCPLSAYNPIPEKKKKDSPYAGFLLFLFLCTCISLGVMYTQSYVYSSLNK